MSQGKISLKLRAPNGLLPLDNIASKTKLFDFKKELSKKTNINAECLIIKVGYPPKNIADSSNDSLLTEFGISDGDLIIIEENTKIPIKANLDTSKNKQPDLSSIALEQIPNKDGLIMIRRVVPADNSCLFRSVAYCLDPKAAFHSEEVRQIVAGYILSDPKSFEGLLEKPVDEYAVWIMKETSWGGEPELDILSKHFDIEICAINILTCQPLFFNSAAKKRIFLLYDGVHYDPVSRNICEEITENDITKFEKNDQAALDGCIVLANNLRNLHQFTDVSNFDIQCLVCLEGLKGEKGVAEHSKKTGHFNFKEIMK